MRPPNHILVALVVLNVTGWLAGCLPKREQPREPFDATGLSNPLGSTSLGSHVEYRSRFGAGWQALLGGQTGVARQRFRDLLKLPPAGVSREMLYPVEAGLGYVDLAEGRLGEAELHFDMALRHEPRYAAAHEGKALVFEARGAYSEALREFQAALGGGGVMRAGLKLRVDMVRLKGAEAALARSRDLHAQGALREAAQACQEASRFTPEREEVWSRLGQLQEQLGESEQAVEAYREATRVAPNNPDNWVRLAGALSRMGRTEEAREAVESALVLPDGEEAARGLAEQLRRDARRQASSSPEVQRVLESSVLDRAGLASLLITRLPLLQRAARAPSRPPAVTDIYNSWARDQIQEVVVLGLMEIYDNHTFKPSQPVSRQELARAASRTIRLMRASGWLAERPFPRARVVDVPEFHLLYPDILEVLRYEIMSLESDGRFDPERLVDGAEAARVVDRVAALVR